MPPSTRAIVLASSSSFRKSLLSKLRLDFIADAPNVNESRLLAETPENQAARLARIKAKALSDKYPNHLIIGSDQVAMLDQQQLTKPGTSQNAIQQLTDCSGQRVHFFTAICIHDSQSKKTLVDCDICKVHFKPLNDKQIRRYVDLDQPLACAGSFKSEGLGIALIKKIEGDDPNALVGLPLIKLIDLLAGFGIEIPER